MEEAYKMDNELDMQVQHWSPKGGKKLAQEAQAMEVRQDSEDEQRMTMPATVFESGVVYTGQWLGGLKDGYGEQLWPDRTRYVGEWRLD